MLVMRRRKCTLKGLIEVCLEHTVTDWLKGVWDEEGRDVNAT